MPKKTTPHSQKSSILRPEDQQSGLAPPDDFLLNPHPDPTVQLFLDDLEPYEDPTRSVPQQRLLNTAYEDAHDHDDTTQSFAIPPERLESLASNPKISSPGRHAEGSNQVEVYDPFMTRETPAPATPQHRQGHGKPRGTVKQRSTIKMGPVGARPRAAAYTSLESDQTAARFAPAQLRDIDEDGFHLFVLRPDAQGRVVLPRSFFGAQGDPQGAMLLVKAKVLRSD